MQIRILNAKEITETLSMESCIAAMQQAFEELQAAEVTMPLRAVIKIPKQDAISLFMPAYMPKKQQLGIKIVSAFPHNIKANLPVINGVVILLDDQTGQPKAILDGTTLTALRTGAVSGLATALLARTNAQSVAIIGTGVQAKTQLEAVCCVRDIKKVWVYSPNRKNAQRFVEELSLKNSIPQIEIANLVHEATKFADIICTATPTAMPIIEYSDVKPGTHINAVGSHSAQMCELSKELMSNAKVVVDQRAAALAEAGDVIQAINAGMLQENSLIELGNLIHNPKLGRNSPEQITIFKSVGLAIQDVSAAQKALEIAIEMQRGTLVEF